MTSVSIIGCGWFGMQLAENLLQGPYTVLGSSTREERLPGLRQAGVQAFQLQVSAEAIRGSSGHEALFTADITVLNLPPGRKSGTPVDYPGKIALLLSHLPEHSKILFISSTSVYGAGNASVNENTPCQPETPAGKVLLAAEQSLPPGRSSILRFAGLIGPTRPPGRFMAGKTDIPNGRVPVNLVQGSDCVAVSRKLIEQQIWGEVFNVCASEHPHRQDYYREECRKLGLPLPTFRDEGGVWKLIDNSKLRKALKFEFSPLATSASHADEPHRPL